MIVDYFLSEFITDCFRTNNTPIAFFTKLPRECRTNELRGYLNLDECSRASRFHFRSDYDSFVIAHAIKRVSLGALINRAPIDVTLAFGAHGKPMLNSAKHEAPFHFSLSRSKGMVAFAIAPYTLIGVDIEHINLNIDTDDLARSLLSAQERELLNNANASSRQDLLFQLWTAKEAYIKGIGLGLSVPLDSFFVEALGHFSRICDSISGRSLNWKTQSIQPTSKHFMSSAIDCRSAPDCRVTFLELPTEMIG